MTNPPVPGADAPSRAVAPRPAASMVLLRGLEGAADSADPTALQVLMGRRSETARFMPGVYVFPGGALDAADAEEAPRILGPDAAPAQLLRTCPAAAAPGLLWAALRETWEETGVLIGAGTPSPRAVPDVPARTPALDAYAAAGLAPAGRAHYIARAITPALSPIRFDTRFFLAFAEDAHGTPRASGELPAVEWVAVETALAAEKVRGVSKFVLREALTLAAARARLADPDRPVPCFTYEGERRVVTPE